MYSHQSGNRPVRQHPALHRSSRHNPCPICGRVKDSDCRWGDEWIACHSGAKANSLSVSDTIEALGRVWYLSRINGGHSGASHIYKPHRPGQSPRQQRRQIRLQATLQPLLKQLFAQCRQQVQTCLAMPELVTLTAPEVAAEHAHATGTLANLDALHRQLLVARRTSAEATRLLLAIRHWRRLVSYQLEDVNRFPRCQLGTPTQQQISEVEMRP